MNDNIDVRDYNELASAVALAQHTVYKRYLTELELYPLVEPTPILLDEKPEDCIRLFRMKELSCKQGEDMFQKLSTVYHASMSLGCNLIVMVDVASIDAPADIYIGVRNSGEGAEEKANLGASFRALQNGIKSNFPGTRFSDVPSQSELPKLMDDIFGNASKYIASVSCVASIRDKSKTENKAFVQGLERFIDAMQGNTYTALFIAEPIAISEQAEIRDGYESLYSTLSSFEKSVWSYNENESRAVMESLSKGVSKSITEGTSHTQSHTFNVGINIGLNSSKSNSDSTSHTNADSRTIQLGDAELARVIKGGAIRLIGKKIAKKHPLMGLAVSTVGDVMQGGSVTHSISDTITSTIGKSLGLGGGVNAGYARTKSDTTLHTDTDTFSETKTTGQTDTEGSGITLQIENVNKPIQEMLKRIEEQLSRTQEGEDYGAYSCGAYFLSGRQESSLLAANTYRALMLGEGSAVESGAINSWNGREEPEEVEAMKQYLRRFIHPLFAMPIPQTVNDIADFVTYTPGTTVSGLELPLHLGLPTKSVYGLPVLEHAEFGRNVVEKDSALGSGDERKVKIGSIYHMGQIEEKSAVELSVAGLPAHTFITGSTGSGKSNTIYRILDALCSQGVHFLVVEPAKGEYKNKDAFGGRPDVTVFGTNNRLKEIELLRINPFSFPDNTHVLEHMDRLVEIFNVCWPMYAAMPAILKDSIQRAYEIAGWDMETSENRYDRRIFPSFVDVYEQIRTVLNESDYSQDNKGDYTGSLVTRLKSLTNGINGLIFTPDEIPSEVLFDSNVIVDLSRVGSAETKALIMGLLVLKLQEYRMETPTPNQKLHHVTVLEEAHNLLKRTSTEQPSEGSNLLGKSVEMLANSIAEMRTYGEGFVIADQSPGLLDMSVIRNTNTKIILRLPDLSDRELVGHAAGLNDQQIAELAKLEKGVAAVNQSEWLETVLCKVDKYAAGNGSGERDGNAVRIAPAVDTAEMSRSLLQCIMENELYRKGDRADILKLKDRVIKSKLRAEVKCEFMDYILADTDTAVTSLRKLVYDFFHAEKAVQKAVNHSDITEWANAVVERLEPPINGYSRQQLDLLMALIVYEKADRDRSYDMLLCKFTEMYRERGGVL